MTEGASPEVPRTDAGAWPRRVVQNTDRWLRTQFLAAGPVPRREKKGYDFWGPILLTIGTFEILGAASETLENAIPWPTISSTVGHLEDRWDFVGVIVVGVIAATAFHALAPSDRRLRGRAVRPGAPPLRPLPRIYDWPLVVGAVVAGGLAAWAAGWGKYEIGYTIYGLLALLGIAVPSILAYWLARSVRFPTLFHTIRLLRRRFHWVAVVIVCGLAILAIHLAFYPWPDLARESAKYAGLSSSQARAAAVRKIESIDPGTTLRYRSAARGSFADRDAWLVYFATSSGFGSRCVVAVSRAAGATPSPECSTS